VVADWTRPQSDERLLDKTGRTWDAWLAELDAWHAWTKTHTEIARYLQSELGVAGWWAQTITLGYERARGMRATNEHKDGFRVSVSKTFSAPGGDVFDAVHAAIAAEAEGVRTATAPKSARYDWAPGRVHVVVAPKGDGKTLVAISHERLAGAGEVEAMRAHWRARLAELANR
jgi:hypothetical protein